MLIEKISQEELEFMECWSNPICLAESLFCNVDNLAEWSSDKLGDIRLYQYPLFSFEPIIDTNIAHLNKKERFQLRKGAGDVFAYGSRRHGKCEKFDSLCLLSSGEYKTYFSLINQKAKVLSLNENTLQIEEAEANFFDNGEKQCYRLSLTSGKYLEITENHPVLTNYGWQKLEDLKKFNNLFIATPRKIDIKKSKLTVEENLAKLLGYLLGDGGCSQGVVSFTNTNEDLIEEFKATVNFFDCELRQKEISYYIRKIKRPYIAKKYIKGVGYTRGIGNLKNNVNSIVKKYKINTLSKNKEIPKEVFRWENKYIAVLLNRLYACDGHISKKLNNIEIVLASKKMIYQISSLLLRFGIRSRIYYKKSKCNDKVFDAWRCVVYSDYNKFLNEIGIKSKDSGYRVRDLEYTTSDVIPKNLILNIYEIRNKDEIKKIRVIGRCLDCDKAISNRAIRCKTCANKGKNNPYYKNGQYKEKALFKYNPTLLKLRKFNKVFENKEIQRYINANIFWDKVKSIEDIGKHRTVMVTMKKNHNYISNDIYSHNTICVEKLDIPISMLHDDNMWCGCSSADQIHLDGVLDDVKDGIDYHPILSSWRVIIRKNPKWKITAKNGWKLDGVNMNVKSAKSPGDSFYGKHFKKLWIEEQSLETEKVYDKRKDALSEFGAVLRFSGMCNFTKHSPSGKIFYDKTYKSKIVNLPQYVNPYFDETEKKERIKEYAGQESINYRVFVEGEVVEDGVSEFDMERVSTCYDEKVEIKRFEIKKTQFKDFSKLIVVERPKNCERLYICGDVGDNTTELIIISEVGSNYNYLYNITLYGLIKDEQEEIINFLINRLDANIVGIDCGDALGRILCDGLEKKYSKDNVVRYAGASKIPVDFERHSDNTVVIESGQPKERMEYMAEWSVNRLKVLLYNNRIFLPLDYKLDKQINSVISTLSGTRRIYACVCESGDHLFDAFKVFAITQWLKKDFNKTVSMKKPWALGVNNV